MPIDTLPRLGLGTVSDDPSEWKANVKTALEVGYRHIDTAQMYENERYVGEGIAAADVDREDVFVATKTVDDDRPDGPEDVEDAIDESLDRLGLEYVDLFYVHWPASVYDPEIVLPQYQAAVDDGRVRNVGVANFTPELLDEAREILDAPIAAHQVEYHPLLEQDRLLEYAQENDHWLVAYSPVARQEVFGVPEIEAIADEHDATAAQVSLAWLLSKDNVAAIPKSSSEAHMRENLEAMELELTDEEIARIDAIDTEHRVIDPDFGPWNQ
jgi:2,5-diketo-D-gluconate reductase B